MNTTMLKNSDLEQFKGKNILITGGTGLIGRQIIDTLYKCNANINTVSLDKIKLSGYSKYIVNYIYGNLTDFNFCMNITKNIDYVFHIAGIKGNTVVTKTKPASFFVPLLQMNTNIIEASRINNVEKLVYTSSIGAYQELSKELISEQDNDYQINPMDTYPGWAKRMAEFQIQSYKIQYNINDYTTVRLSNVYGPGDNFDSDSAMIIPSLIYKIYQYQHTKKPIVLWGDGSEIRDFTYSKDIAEGIILALLYSHNIKQSNFLNLGSGNPISIKELVDTLHSLYNFEYIFDKSKSSGYNKRVLDISLAKNTIEYNPKTSIKEGLSRTMEWFKNNNVEYLKRKNYFI